MATKPSYTKTSHQLSYPAISPTRAELSLHGKTAVVTGAGTGIGLAIAKSLALAGISKLAIIGRRAEVLSKAAAEIFDLVGDKTIVLIIPADISKKDQIDKAFSQISTEFATSALDILVNNAAVFSGLRPFGTETEEEWDSVWNINVKGLYFVCSAFVAKAKPNATIITVSSHIVHTQPLPGLSSYATTKMGGMQIIRYLQAEYPEIHTVNVHPGTVSETEQCRKYFPNLPHMDDDELPGNFVVWLASQEAKFLKGKYVWANWDVNELKENAMVIKDTPLFTLGLEGFSSFEY